MKAANLALRFFLELAAPAALAYWGWGVSWVLAILAPAAAALWAAGQAVWAVVLFAVWAANTAALTAMD